MALGRAACGRSACMVVRKPIELACDRAPALVRSTEAYGPVSDRGGAFGVIHLKYSLVIEATDDPNFFGFYSPDLLGFTGVGHSIEDCLCRARSAMEQHIALLQEFGLPVPGLNPNPTVAMHQEHTVSPPDDEV